MTWSSPKPTRFDPVQCDGGLDLKMVGQRTVALADVDEPRLVDVAPGPHAAREDPVDVLAEDPEATEGGQDIGGQVEQVGLRNLPQGTPGPAAPGGLHLVTLLVLLVLRQIGAEVQAGCRISRLDCPRPWYARPLDGQPVQPVQDLGVPDDVVVDQAVDVERGTPLPEQPVQDRQIEGAVVEDHRQAAVGL